MAVRSARGVFGPGEWAVMGNDGVVHLAETQSGLPSSGARCGFFAHRVHGTVARRHAVPARDRSLLPDLLADSASPR